MALGTVRTSVLTDIANAIRWQAGVTRLYHPSQMAAAVAALDGTREGPAGVEPYMQLEAGVLSSVVFDDLGDAIRAQNGSQTRYAPEDMAAAIRALTWDTGVKARALLLDDGTLELNYRDGRRSDLGTIVQCWEVDVAGYGSDMARPWHEARAQVKRVAFDADWVGAGMTNYGYFFHSMTNLVEVVGFEACSGATCLDHAFTSCSRLETIWATSFDGSSIVSAVYPLNGCYRLVGQTGYVAPNSAGAAALSFGSSGVLTNPAQDQRVWVWGHLYSDGELEITTSSATSALRVVEVSGRICVNAHYLAVGCAPWYEGRAGLRLCTFKADLASMTLTSMDYWFYSCSSLLLLTGWENVRGLASMRQTFNSCSGLAALYLMGLDPGSLADLAFTFASCSALETIYVDGTWVLPTGCTGMGTFYGCSRIVGGNGTSYSSSATGCSMMVVDVVGQAGYLTAAN